MLMSSSYSDCLPNASAVHMAMTHAHDAAEERGNNELKQCRKGSDCVVALTL